MAWDSASFPWDWDADTILVPDHQSCVELRKLAGSSRPHDVELSVLRNGTPTFTGKDMCPAVLKTGSMSSMKHARWDGADHIDVDLGAAMANTYGVLPVGQGADSCMEPEKLSIITGCIGNGSFPGCGNNSGFQSPQLPNMVHSELHKTNFFVQKIEGCSTKVKAESDALEGAKAAYMDEQHSSNATGSAGSGDSLTGLQLGKRTYPLDGTRVTSKGAQRPIVATKKARTAVAVPRCQVEGCKLDLSSAKDYHRRHKVCETHSKTEKVIVASMEQRFCQQCSRFHLLAEFDEAKRSCRRRLAGHNKRRRKPQPDPFALHARMHSTYEDWSLLPQQKFSGMSLLWQEPNGFRSGGMWPYMTNMVEDQPAYDYMMQGLGMGRLGHTNGLLPQQCDDKLSLLLLQSPKVLMPENVHPRVHRWPLGTLSPMGDTLTLAPASVEGGVMPGLDVTTLVTRAVTRVSDSGRALSLLSVQPRSCHAPGVVKLEPPGLTALTTMDHLQPMMHEAVHHQPFLMQGGSMVTFEKDVDCSYGPDLNRQASSYPLFMPMAYHHEDGLSGGRPA